MRKPLVAMFVLALGLTSTTPALAEPARGSSASGYGLEATGLLRIPRTPEVSATNPPDASQDRKVTLPLDVTPLAISGTIGAIATAHTADDVNAQIEGVRDGNNARAFTETEGLAVVLQGQVDLLGPEPVAKTSLVTAQVVAAEAVAKCVNNRPEFDTGYRLVGLFLGPNELKVVDDLLQQVVNLLGPTGPLSIVVSIAQNERIPLADGIAVNALHIKIPLLNEDIIVSHSEVHMPTPCGLGAGPPQVAGGPRLAPTGGEPSLLIASGLLVMAFLVRMFVRRSRSATTS